MSLICPHCNRISNNPGANARHVNNCHSNPNYVNKGRSPHAGQKKGCKSWNAGKKTGTNPYYENKFPLDKVMVENSTYATGNIKRRLIQNGMLQNKCQICGIDPIWNGKPMTLVLDHINGINNDHRMENLRLVCNNCDSQLITFKGRNKYITGDTKRPRAVCPSKPVVTNQ